MPDIILVIRWMHILAGSTAFVVAPVAMIVHKGGNAHRLWGKVYLWAMFVAAVGALVVSLWRPNYFLLGLSVFSFHICFFGYRVLFRKRPEKGEKPNFADWFASGITIAMGLVMLFLGITSAGTDGKILFGVFGVMMIISGYQSIKDYRATKREKNAWFIQHMQNMLASYIAATTAFCAVNFTQYIGIWAWLGPTAIGAPLIAVWVRSYRLKFEKGRAAKEVADVRIGAAE